MLVSYLISQALHHRTSSFKLRSENFSELFDIIELLLDYLRRLSFQVVCHILFQMLIEAMLSMQYGLEDLNVLMLLDCRHLYK